MSLSPEYILRRQSPLHIDVVLGFTPSVSDSFPILDNDGADLVVGSFDGLAQLSTFDVTFEDDIVTFQIDYAGGDGNDVELTTTNVAVAPTIATATAAASAASPAAWLTGGDGDESLVFDPQQPDDAVARVDVADPQEMAALGLADIEPGPEASPSVAESSDYALAPVLEDEVGVVGLDTGGPGHTDWVV